MREGSHAVAQQSLSAMMQNVGRCLDTLVHVQATIPSTFLEKQLVLDDGLHFPMLTKPIGVFSTGRTCTGKPRGNRASVHERAQDAKVTSQLVGDKRLRQLSHSTKDEGMVYPDLLNPTKTIPANHSEGIKVHGYRENSCTRCISPACQPYSEQENNHKGMFASS